MLDPTTHNPWLVRHRARVRGCLLGGALGDALGAPVEFLALDQITAVYGPYGITAPVAGPAGQAQITDDTQMTLFTVEGLIRTALQSDHGVTDPASVIYRAHLRWLDTQRLDEPPNQPDGWLAAQSWLYAQRAPGHTCVSGLRAGRMGTLSQPQNPQSKGCGAVMRSAPFGLCPHPRLSPREAFDLAVACATHTHGHPSGYLAAGAFAAIIHCLTRGQDLRPAVDVALELLATHPGHEETTASLRQALTAGTRGPAPGEVERIGAGWVAEEALAIGVYCALAHPAPTDVRHALILAVNHSGDSDSTGSICGNLLGTWHGDAALPADWITNLEGRDTIRTLAEDLSMAYTQAAAHGDRESDTNWKARYH